MATTIAHADAFPQKKHDADQAGGAKEVVYSSDGAESTPIEFPLKKTKDEDLIDSELMTAEQAFEVFAGKLYAVNPYSNKRDDANQNESKEPPLQRLGRLKRELKELENDCASKDDSDLLQDQLAQLQDQLQRLSMAQLQKQKSLSASIQASVVGLKESDKPRVPPSITSPVITPDIEDRLNRLEKAVGSASGNSLNINLLERLEALESMQSKLDDKKLDILHKRGKVIRQDLEAAAKARHKLAAGSTVTTSAEDSKTIAALYDQLQQLRNMSQHLPALTARLQALAHQHVDAATRTARFQAVEHVTAKLEQQVQSIETALTALDVSMQQNAATMHENIQALEERMKSL